MSKHEFENSSSISWCDYDDTEGCMKIKFHSGKTYRYECGKDCYEALKTAASPGKHFHSNIRPHYKGVVCD